MIGIEEAGVGVCFCCRKSNDQIDDDGESVYEVRDLVFSDPEDRERRIPLCVVCRNELFDELTPDDGDGEDKVMVRELNW